MNAALQIPGLANGWTMPIKGRIEMLSTGIRTPLGLKIAGVGSEGDRGDRRAGRDRAGKVPGTRSVFAERTGSGFFLDIEWDREALSRYGLSIEEAQSTVENAIGGDNVTTVVQGQERYPDQRPLPARFPVRPQRRRARAGLDAGRADPDPAGPTRPGHGSPTDRR